MYLKDFNNGYHIYNFHLKFNQIESPQQTRQRPGDQRYDANIIQQSFRKSLCLYNKPIKR